MHKPDPVETILARLMPPALSEEGQREIAAMIDELAGEPETLAKPMARIVPFRRPAVAAGIAAAIVAAAVAWPLVFPPSRIPVAAASPAPEAEPGIFVMSESGSIRSVSDEGWQEDADGSTMRALRLDVVEENDLFDEETGIVMQVSEPREEILLMPVSAF
jgi:hypothetical protein